MKPANVQRRVIVPSRRELFTLGLSGLALTRCARPADWCESPQLMEDGPPDGCAYTASNIEGPYYREGAPERLDLDLWDDDGDRIVLRGTCWDGACGTPLAGAILDVWQADPSGDYDNSSDEMRYRGLLVTDENGAWELRTLMPGFYLNGTTFRPAHIHVKVWADGVERLTTQLYFEGDPHLECDPFANTSLVIPLQDSEEGQIGEFDFLV